MPVTYVAPANTVVTNGPQQITLGQSQNRTIAIFADFPIGPDFPVQVAPNQMASIFGDPTKSSSMGYRGPYLAWFASQQKSPVSSTQGVQYLVQRLNVTRASYNLLDDGASLTAFSLAGIGKYAGSKGNNLQVSVTRTGSPTNQVWTLTLTGTGLGGTYTLTLPGYCAAQTFNETDTAATLQSTLRTALGTNAVTVTGTTWGATGGTYTITAGGVLAASVLPNFTVNATGLTGTTPVLGSVIATPGVRPTVQTIKVFDSTVSTTTPLVTFADTSVAGGTYNLTSNQSIVNAINGANPLSNVNSIVQATLGSSSAPPAVVTLQTLNTVVGADGQGATVSSLTQALMQNSLWTTADYVVTCFDAALVAATLIAHSTDALAQNDFRKFYLGPTAGTTYTSLSTSYVTSAMQNDRLNIAGNDNFTANHPATGVPTQWDGFYIGAIAAGLKASAPESETCAGQAFAIQGITQVGPSTGLSQQLIASQVTALETQGLFVLVKDPQTGVIYIHNALTTAPYASPTNQNAVNPFTQGSVRDFDDRMSRTVIQATQPFLLRPRGGKTNLAAIQIALRNNIAPITGQTNGINYITATQDPVTLAITPSVSYIARYPITQITNQTAFTLS